MIFSPVMETLKILNQTQLIIIFQELLLSQHLGIFVLGKKWAKEEEPAKTTTGQFLLTGSTR